MDELGILFLEVLVKMNENIEKVFYSLVVDIKKRIIDMSKME